MSTRRCARCGETKPPVEFARNRTKKSGYSSYCKVCHNQIVRANKEKNHGSERGFLLQHRYGIDLATLNWLVLQQGGVCALCKTGTPAHVDHDHSTGKVRGILCFNCNRALGYFDDDLDRLYKAADYLERTHA